jgi:hypothetical protein
MADTLVQRVTCSPAQYAPPTEPSPRETSTDIGSASHQPSESAEPSPAGCEGVAQPSQTVEIHLVMTDRALLAGGHEPALLSGPGATESNLGGGPTSLDNGQGLCERCNQTKNLPGWSAQTIKPRTHRDPEPDRDANRGPDREPSQDSGGGTRAGGSGGHVVRTTTPTGHVYESAPPRLLGALPQPRAPQDRFRARGRSPSPATAP